MSTQSDALANGTARGAPGDPDAIRADIERTRDDLAETVDALHAKLDVKRQVRARVVRAKQAATTDSGRPRPGLVAGTVGVLVLAAGLIWWRKR